jgi:hypothetical protein
MEAEFKMQQIISDAGFSTKRQKAKVKELQEIGN